VKSLLLGYDAKGRPIRLKLEDRRTHAHVVGSSGSGKSKFLESLMRGDLKNHQGFCLIDPHGTLYDEMAAYCAHHVLDREILFLDLSRPEQIVGFNPFQRSPDGDVSVQVDRRIAATMHAWNVENTDETPTLARTLRLIYTVMLELNVGLPQVSHLIDFNAHKVRGHLIDRLKNPLIQNEWRELQQLKAKDFRQETLSAKNRLFKFLSSKALCRFMGLPGTSINLQDVMDQGKILLVNLAASDHLSHDNARAFGALLVNEFFECALRRKKSERGKDPEPYYLYLDEFQNFVSLDVANMLDEVRKFGLFLVLAHQRFGQLDENIRDGILTNCGIKAVFGGLPVESAQLMASELFIGELDPTKIKAAIYQTKFWPQYSRDKVYGRATSHTTGTMQSTSSSSTEGSVFGSVMGDSTTASFFQGQDWFSIPQPTGMGAQTSSSSLSDISSQNSSTGESLGESEGFSEVDSEADIPIFIPVPFQELSSIQYFTMDEQLTQLTAALKEQFQRHCFIKVKQQPTQPMLVPFVKRFTTSTENVRWYRGQQLQKYSALPISEVDRLLEEQDAALLDRINLADKTQEPKIVATASAQEEQPQPTQKIRRPIWDRSDNSKIWQTSGNSSSDSRKTERKRGPKPDLENHQKVASLVRRYEDDWILDENLEQICEMLDQLQIPIPKTWPTRIDGKSHSWSRAFENYPHLVVKAIKDRCRAAEPQG
jgi:hypothetical protein